MDHFTRIRLLLAVSFLAAPGAALGDVPPLSGGEYRLWVDADRTKPGIVGSYVDENLRRYQPQDDWRRTQDISGARIDPALDFTDKSWGERADVGLTGGSDSNWENFSTQWDGWIEILTDGMRVATRSDDSSRMWIDLNGDGTFDESGAEFIDNHWGQGQPATLGDLSEPLPKGMYRFRVQYEEATGGNILQLLSPADPTLRIAYLIPSNRTPQPDAMVNFREVVRIGADWWCEQMDRNGFGPYAFRYETEDDGITPRIWVVDLAETDDYLRGNIWGRVNDAAGAAGVPIWTPGEVWVLVPEIHVQLPDGSIEGGVALGASFGSGDDPGVAMIGSAQLSIANADGLLDDTPYDGLVIPGIGPYPLVQSVSFPWFEGTTISSLVSSYIGATWHEAGHAFGLGHDWRNDANFHGNLMFNGLRGIRGAVHPDHYPEDDTRLAYAAALAIDVSRYMADCELRAPSAGPPRGRPPGWGEPLDGAMTLPFTQVLGAACAADGVEPLPTRTVSDTRGAPVASGGDNERPEVEILTSGPVALENGHVVIHFHASDDQSLAVALLRLGFETVAEMTLEGVDVDAAFATPFFEPGEGNDFSISVYDHGGNRRDAATTVVPQTGSNRAPQPFFKVKPSQTPVDATVVLDAGPSHDPDGGSLIVEWDLDDDGEFDTPPSSRRTLDVTFAEPGPRRVRVRLTDDDDVATVSTPIAVRVWPGGLPPCPADLDNSGDVGVSDFLELLGAWGTCPPKGDCPADFDGDGAVGVSDFLALLANWGPCP